MHSFLKKYLLSGVLHIIISFHSHSSWILLLSLFIDMKTEAQKERTEEGVGGDDVVFPRTEPRQAVPLLPDGQPEQVLEGSGKPQAGRVPQAKRQETLEEREEDQPEGAREHGAKKTRKMSRSTSIAC